MVLGINTTAFSAGSTSVLGTTSTFNDYVDLGSSVSTTATSVAGTGLLMNTQITITQLADLQQARDYIQTLTVEEATQYMKRLEELGVSFDEEEVSLSESTESHIR